MDDHHEGQRVSRRTLIRGVASLTFGGVLAGCSSDGGSKGAAPAASDVFSGTNTCMLTASATQGPYYFDADKIRSDIREDRSGTRLKLALKVQDVTKCAPLASAVVEVWHCDAGGLYSGAESQSTGGPGGGPGGGGGDLVPTDDKRYLRGAQVSAADGTVAFTTIWPGWYRGRTVHIHVMVHVDNKRVLTSQLMFDESLNTKVFADAPYASRTGRDTFNANDSIFRDSMLLKVSRDGDGWLGAISLGVDN